MESDRQTNVEVSEKSDPYEPGIYFGFAGGALLEFVGVIGIVSEEYLVGGMITAAGLGAMGIGCYYLGRDHERRRNSSE